MILADEERVDEYPIAASLLVDPLYGEVVTGPTSVVLTTGPVSLAATSGSVGGAPGEVGVTAAADRQDLAVPRRVRDTASVPNGQVGQAVVVPHRRIPNGRRVVAVQVRPGVGPLEEAGLARSPEEGQLVATPVTQQGSGLRRPSTEADVATAGVGRPPVDTC